MKKIFGSMLVATIAGAASIFSAGSASAVQYSNVPGWSSPAQIAPTGTVCFETGGGRVLGPSIVAAAAGWNKSDLTVIAKTSCAGYARPNVMKFKAVYSSAKTSSGMVTFCARYQGGHYTWKLVRGMSVWVADTPTVEVNYSALAVKQCMNSTAKKTNMMSHETGHYFGLSHAVGITVMGAAQSSTYIVPTIYDIRRINTRY